MHAVRQMPIFIDKVPRRNTGPTDENDENGTNVSREEAELDGLRKWYVIKGHIYQWYFRVIYDHK